VMYLTVVHSFGASDRMQGCPVAPSDILCHGISICSNDRFDRNMRRNIDRPLLSPTVSGRPSMVVALFLQQCECRILFVLIFSLVFISEVGFSWRFAGYGIRDVHVYDLHGSIPILWSCRGHFFLLVHEDNLRGFEGRLNKVIHRKPQLHIVRHNSDAT